MKKLSPRRKLEKALDKLSKDCAKARDKYICQKCGKVGGQMHGSHVIPVSAGKRLRWDIMNIKCLCAYCHRRFWHSSPMEACKWFSEVFPERWEYLQREKAKGSKKWSIEELELLKDWLEDYLEELDISN